MKCVIPMKNLVSRREFLSLSLVTLPLSSQQPTFTAGVKVVNVFATVRNKQGDIIRNLKKEEFTLTEDGRPQTIRYFSQQSDLPLTLGLLVDTSGSQRRVLEAERTASYRFLDQVLREDKDTAFVIRFDRDVELMQDFTSSRKELESALAALRVDAAGLRRRSTGSPPPSRRGPGGTSLYDSVLLAADDLMRKQTGRKALIMLSDGVDTGSRLSFNDAIEAAQRADTLVYTIRFFDGQIYGRLGRGRSPRGNTGLPDGRKTLEKLARETGGGYFDVSPSQTIEKTYEQIQEELRNQYSLGYTTDKPNDPGFRKIKLTVKPKNLLVQTRTGYFHEP